MNAELSTSFTKEEVFMALKQMHPTKALGPDGCPPLFYQRHWNTVGESVAAVVLQVLNIANFISYLIRDNACAWDVSKIRSLFHLHEAATSLKIPLSSQPQLDKWIWTGEKNENFSMNSAYCLLQNNN